MKKSQKTMKNLCSSQGTSNVCWVYENNVKVKMHTLGRKRSLVLEVGNDLFFCGVQGWKMF